MRTITSRSSPTAEACSPGTEFAVRLAAGRADPARPQGGARRYRRRRNHPPLWRGHRPCRGADREGQLGQGIAGADAGRAVVRQSAEAERRRDQAAAAGRLHVRRLSQCRWLGRHPQHPGDLDQRAMRRRHRRVRAGPDSQGAVAEISQRRRRGGDHACLWLRRRDQRAGRRGADPHAAEPRPQSQFRRRGDDRRSRLREAAARIAAARGHERRR